MQPIITVENLGKKYRIGAGAARYGSLRDSIAGFVSSPLARFRKRAMSDADTIWALNDVNFEVRPGEILGIIGRNGAGKSTLLKILSRITSPTTGRVALHGRVGSLLEVGTGFHPELTGRENIFLNGAILGMTRSEIKAKFDEIVAFAETDQFLDTPVKYYSSGMYMRLAFAVAVHLEPEILVVDEVLAVGDAQFQRKCLEKMREVGKGGRTILFVSHNMSAVRSICDRGIALDRGAVVEDGPIDCVVDQYLAKGFDKPQTGVRIETESFVVERVAIQSKSGSVIKTFDPVSIIVEYTAKTDIRDPGLYVGILTLDGYRLMGLDFKDFETIQSVPAGKRQNMGFVVEQLTLLPGAYQLEIHLKDMAAAKFEVVGERFGFEVVETPVYQGRHLDSWFGSVGLKATACHTSVNAHP